MGGFCHKNEETAHKSVAYRSGHLAFRYKAAIQVGALDPDPVQAQLIHVLSNFADQQFDQAGELIELPKSKDFVSKLLGAWQQSVAWLFPFLGFAHLSGRKIRLPAGLYIHGGVGAGKSILMDMAYDVLATERKQRVHFHAFMQDVHQFVHQWRSQGQSGAYKDPIEAVACDIASRVTLLCFDEFHVNDIADAMILSKLFRRLRHNGVRVIATSNFAPFKLYEGGLQRQLFLPFIRWIETHYHVYGLDNTTDHRRRALAGNPVWFYPLLPSSEAKLDAAFEKLTDGRSPAPTQVELLGRTLQVPAAARSVARFTFDELCNNPLGAADYLALVREFSAICISGVPCLSSEHNDLARRLQLLVDAAYETHTRLIVSAQGPPESIYQGGKLSFEFERTLSRLIEMQSSDYALKAHAPEKASVR